MDIARSRLEVCEDILAKEVHNVDENIGRCDTKLHHDKLDNGCRCVVSRVVSSLEKQSK